jgi:hypothetical protein
MRELALLLERFWATFGVVGVAAMWALKAGATWIGLRWFRNRRRVG